MQTVFVYGTLLQKLNNYHYIENHVYKTESGIVKGFLYNTGPYPAIVIDENGMNVVGEWVHVDDAAMGVLDWLEQYEQPGQVNEYERVWVKDAERKKEGWIYTYSLLQAEHYPLIPSGSWREYLLSYRKRQG
ncbi:gamma-glutamylcyclotransferase family protein [Marinococcus sp. PL1-022]|uniref:gamma-glutamylcyclotransferase family protein n=1 Tax=Marinococcus sp. PL1-022 TaxID=3095363 RepID=UPI0029C23AF5|nr:gamma-glutamylcyclotransferase family protein [Marinococcus sp. PL1-022]MDX6152905.1 gamma-glutamylcyclotransferase family protein [Marinococcus sp. PL1-022]